MLWGFAIRSAGYAFPPLGVPADLQSIALDMPIPPLGVPADMLSAVKN